LERRRILLIEPSALIHPDGTEYIPFNEIYSAQTLLGISVKDIGRMKGNAESAKLTIPLAVVILASKFLINVMTQPHFLVIFT